MYLSEPKCLPQVLDIGLAHNLCVQVGVVLPDLVESFDVEWQLNGGKELPSSDATVSRGADRQSKAYAATADNQDAALTMSDAGLSTSGRAYYCRRASTATELLICFYDDVHGYAKIEFHRRSTWTQEVLKSLGSSSASDQP
ncbi:hypothetical protein AAVH_10893 [Aphelenchoides avenae]|nr:hypothetical protein AAVH_10893 [Aphelenchus avenae]